MTEKGLIYLGVIIGLAILLVSAIALLVIAIRLKEVCKWLKHQTDSITSHKIDNHNVSHVIADRIEDLTNKIGNVYESLFNNAEVTISRNGIKEDEDDDI